MRDASPELKAFLASRQPCWKADLFTFTLVDGTVYRWTSFDRPLTYGGQTWETGQPYLQRSKLGVRNTIEVPELTITVLSNGADGVLEMIDRGAFDQAQVELDRLFMPAPGDTSLGPVLMFLGQMSTSKTTAEGAELTVKGANVLLGQNGPRNLYQTTCNWSFCDPNCGLDPADFTLDTTVGPGSTATVIAWGSLPVDPTLYTFGKLTITDGDGAGQVRSIRQATNAGIFLVYPLDTVPAAGDAIAVLQGDDRQYATCKNRFGNDQNFRGFPFVPPAETGL